MHYIPFSWNAVLDVALFPRETSKPLVAGYLYWVTYMGPLLLRKRHWYSLTGMCICSAYNCAFPTHNAAAGTNKHGLRGSLISLILFHIQLLLTRKHAPQQKEKGNTRTSKDVLDLPWPSKQLVWWNSGRAHWRLVNMASHITLGATVSCRLGSSGNWLARWVACRKSWNQCLWKRWKGAGLNRDRHWAAMQVQQKPQLTLQGVLKRRLPRAWERGLGLYTLTQ